MTRENVSFVVNPRPLTSAFTAAGVSSSVVFLPGAGCSPRLAAERRLAVLPSDWPAALLMDQ